MTCGGVFKAEPGDAAMEGAVGLLAQQLRVP
jgi:hypothetical protein